MEMKINKTVNVEMDESLGYPIVFIKFDELKNNALAEAIKQKAWESLQQFMGTEQMPDAHKECHVLTHWLDKGYLCYPAYENYLAYRPYNCGPRYIKKINCILEKTDRHAWYEFWGGVRKPDRPDRRLAGWGREGCCGRRGQKGS